MTSLAKAARAVSAQQAELETLKVQVLNRIGEHIRRDLRRFIVLDPGIIRIARWARLSHGYWTGNVNQMLIQEQAAKMRSRA